MNLRKTNWIAMFEQADEAIFLTDSSGRILDVNRFTSDSLGYPRDELLELSMADIEVRLATLETGVLASVEPGLHLCRYLCKDGRSLDVEVRVSTIDDSQLGCCLLLIARDISERLAFETQLQEQNRLLNNILANIPHSIYWKERNLEFAGCNDTFARNVGLQSPSQVVGKSAADLYGSTEEGIHFQQCDEEVMAKDFPLLGFEEQRQRPDGTTSTLLTNRVPLKNAAGQVNGLLGIYTDITDRRLAEEALAKSESRHKKLSQEFQTLLNGIPDSLMLLSPDLQVVWANQGTAKHLQQDIDSLPGTYCYNIMDQSSEPCADCVALASFRSGESCENVIETADGRVWGIKAFPIKNSRGKVVNVIHLASDITEKKKLREESERSGRLASLGELSAGIAHEINNPNGLVLLNLPLLQDSFNDALPILENHFLEHGNYQLAGLPYEKMRHEIPRLFDEVREGSQRIRQIVDDLKNFVRAEPSENQEPFDLNLSLQKVVRLAANKLNESTGNFSSQYAEGLPLAIGNSQRIEQVVLNLLLNACQALSGRERGIELCSAVDDVGKNLLVEITDQGCGIDAADLPNITDPFFTTRREMGGTGLGLSISARIVKEHKGDLRFESTPDVGTKVTLSLPIGKG